MELTQRQSEAVEGLRELADFLEGKPEMLDRLLRADARRLYVWASTAEDLGRLGLALGHAEKDADDLYYNVTRDFGPLIGLQVTARREKVCEKVVVGVEEVEVEERDPDLVAAALADIPVQRVTKMVEKTEWACPPSLGELVGQ